MADLYRPRRSWALSCTLWLVLLSKVLPIPMVIRKSLAMSQPPHTPLEHTSLVRSRSHHPTLSPPSRNPDASPPIPSPVLSHLFIPLYHTIKPLAPSAIPGLPAMASTTHPASHGKSTGPGSQGTPLRPTLARTFLDNIEATVRHRVPGLHRVPTVCMKATTYNRRLATSLPTQGR
jgi:hypothetical protein